MSYTVSLHTHAALPNDIMININFIDELCNFHVGTNVWLCN